eukprot:TRINITY_DN23364_c0_g1_i1.p1 TRINITY_DN23364_c0_g1~~TRINITY_DN23364_c0_g1_i1.p1  ORF type:complete len:277 (+),score=59.38 TRINITY_DN23364_c0_g1_i1:37-867(+)
MGRADPFRLDGKVVLVTGSCQGLGAAIAAACAAAGARGVIVTGLPREQAKGERVAQALRVGKFHAADLESEQDLRALVAWGAAEFGQIDCLVNCGAINPRATLLTTTADMYHKLFRTNLLSAFVLTQEFAKHRLAARTGRRPGGAVLNVSSVQASGGAPFSMAYSSLKGALLVQTKNNAKELAKHSIRCNAVLPGWMPTDNERQLQMALGAPADWLERADATAPLGRLLRAEDVAHAAVFFLSDASSMATGVCMELHPEQVTGTLADGVGVGDSKL